MKKDFTEYTKRVEEKKRHYKEIKAKIKEGTYVFPEVELWPGDDDDVVEAWEKSLREE